MASPARRTVEDAIKPEPRTTSTTALPFADASRVTPVTLRLAIWVHACRGNATSKVPVSTTGSVGERLSEQRESLPGSAILTEM
jgi:hypothetical protein